MPRPRKRRRVCRLPNYRVFGPMDGNCNNEDIILSIDEHEVIRLIDLEGLEQEQCAQRMNVARSTVQRMYSEAKQKIADCIVNGKILKIEGGDYELCRMDRDCCGSCNQGGHRHRWGRNESKNKL